jgi:hypothetical protein
MFPFGRLRLEDLDSIALSNCFFVLCDGVAVCVTADVFSSLPALFSDVIIHHEKLSNLCWLPSGHGLADLIGIAAVLAGSQEAKALFQKSFLSFNPRRLAGFRTKANVTSFAFYDNTAIYVTQVDFRLLALSPCAFLHPAANNFISTSNVTVIEIVGEETVNERLEQERAYLSSGRR